MRYSNCIRVSRLDIAWSVFCIRVLFDGMTEPNVGGLDRIARVGVGAILAVVGFSLLLAGSLPLYYGGTVLLVAVVLLTTAATQRCLLNEALGRNTCERPTAAE